MTKPSASSDINNLMNLMYALSKLDTKEACMICPCSASCKTNMKQDCFQLLAGYCSDELLKILRSLND